MKRFTGQAPGKVILVGEHAVVYGHPAIAIPVHSVRARVTAEFTRNGGVQVLVPDLSGNGHEISALRAAEGIGRLAQKVLAAFGEGPQNLSLTIHSDIPVGRGMGSSAALCVAAARAICGLLDRRLDQQDLSALALEGEKVFHDTPSGIDNTVVAMGVPIFFAKRRGAQPIQAGRDGFRFLVADTGVASSTAEVVADVRRNRERDRARYDALFWEIGSMCAMAREFVRAGSRAELGMCMERNQDILTAIGVSSPDVDRLVAAAKEAGAAGAKLSGAGRGGNVIALLGDDTDEATLTEALRDAGAAHVIGADLRPES